MLALPPTAAGLLAILILGLAAYFLRRWGILPMSPTEAAAIARADRAERELSAANDREAKANQRIGELEQSKSIKPVLEQQEQVLDKLQEISTILHDVSTVNVQVLDRLASLNGSLTSVKASLDAAEQGLRTATESAKFMAGLVGVVTHQPAQPSA